MFNEGVPAVKKDIMGFRVGRLVGFKSPHEFYGAYIIAGDYQEVNQQGPLFSENRTSFLVSLHEDPNPAYYDELTADPSSLAWTIKDLVRKGETLWEIKFPAAEAVVLFNNKICARSSIAKQANT
ncbi:MAG TPA: hypothetical protein DCZ92_00630 [Elusimicrobia bacterium]|nr:MAG: hypothetical protein A2016_09935 [Elusimicrobia bacterium GWF2_62_30]HBA59331.1 hypothetical protein [Elusimicrobiota bacterium]